MNSSKLIDNRLRLSSLAVGYVCGVGVAILAVTVGQIVGVA